MSFLNIAPSEPQIRPSTYCIRNIYLKKLMKLPMRSYWGQKDIINYYLHAKFFLADKGNSLNFVLYFFPTRRISFKR